jgi:branched-chain amino acid transport system permease protein
MEQLVQVVFTGLSQGGIYALIGLGFSLVMMSTRILNLAHGSFVLFGGFVFLSLTAAWGWAPLVAMLAVLVLMVAVGVATERILNVRARPWRPISLDTAVLTTLALLVVFEGVAFLLWGPDPQRAPALHPGVFSLLGAVVVWQSVWMLVAALAISAGLHLFLRRTWMGRAMRACAESPTTAYLLGINARFVGSLAFALSAALGAFAGLLVSPVTWIDYQMGGFFMLKGVLAYLTGGEEEVAGPLVGGMLLGLVENVLLLLPGMTGGLLKQVVPMAVLIAILVVRPQGILAARRASA